MTTRFATPKPVKPLWQSLLAPMLLASLGLHVLLLLLPTGASDDVVIPPPDPEQDSVAITRVPPPSAPATQPIDGVATTSTPATAQALRGQAQSLAQSSQAGAQATTRQQTSRRSSGGVSQSGSGGTTSSAGVGNTGAGLANSGGSARSAEPSQAAGTNQAVVPTPPPATTEPSRALFDPEIGERLMAYVAALNLPQTQVDNLRASIQDRFGFAAAATSREAYSTNLRDWEESIRQETGEADLSAEVDRTSLSVTYPQRVCLVNDPVEVRVGVLTNPDGSQRGEPVVLRSSGYAALDQKALAAVQDHKFPEADGIKAYTIAVATQVDYGRRPCLNAKPEPVAS